MEGAAIGYDAAIFQNGDITEIQAVGAQPTSRFPEDYPLTAGEAAWITAENQLATKGIFATGVSPDDVSKRQNAGRIVAAQVLLVAGMSCPESRIRREMQRLAQFAAERSCPIVGGNTVHFLEGTDCLVQVVLTGRLPAGEHVQDGEPSDGERVQDGEPSDSERVQDGEAPDGERVQDGEAPDGEHVQDGEAPDGERVQDGEASDGERVQNRPAGTEEESPGSANAASGLLRKPAPGDRVYFLGEVGCLGADLLARSRREELRRHFPESYIETMEYGVEDYSVQEKAAAALEAGAVFLHDVSNGGVHAALYQLAEAAGCGIHVRHEGLTVRQSVIELSEALEINPYLLLGTGGLLAVVPEDTAAEFEGSMTIRKTQPDADPGADGRSGGSFPWAYAGQLTKEKARLVTAENFHMERYLNLPDGDAFEEARSPET